MDTDSSTGKSRSKPVVDRKWNWLLGIDPDVAITREDREWVHSQISDERASNPMARSWTFLLLGFLAVACLPVGVMALKALSWPAWMILVTFFPAGTVLMGLAV